MKSKRLFTVGCIIFCLLLTALVSLNGDIVLMTLPFLVYSAIGILQTPINDKIVLKAVRSVEKTVMGKFASVAVTVRIRNEGRNPVFISIADSVPEGVVVKDGNVRLNTAIRPGNEGVLFYAFRMDRGGYLWDVLRVSVRDPFDLLESEIEVPAPADVVIVPLAGTMRTIKVYPKNTLSAAGSVPTNRGGFGLDFFGIREYRSGDPLRSLDWRLTARHPHGFFTREYVLEKTADIVIVLDARKELELIAGTESLFEHEVHAAASLSKMFLRDGHRVGLLTSGQSLNVVLPDYGKTQQHRILNCLASAVPGTGETLKMIGRIIACHFPRNALLVVISPLDTYDETFYRRLGACGYQMVLICPDTLAFASSILERDEASRLALRLCRLERFLELKKISRLRVSVVDWPVHHPLAPLLGQALQYRRRVQSK